MKMIVALCSSTRVGDLLEVLDRHEVHAFSVIPDLRGAGDTGRHLGTRAFPGTVSMVFTAVPDEVARELLDAIAARKRRCRSGEGLRAFAWSVDEMI